MDIGYCEGQGKINSSMCSTFQKVSKGYNLELDPAVMSSFLGDHKDIGEVGLPNAFNEAVWPSEQLW